MTEKELKAQIEEARKSLDRAISEQYTEEKILKISILLDRLIEDYYKMVG